MCEILNQKRKKKKERTTFCTLMSSKESRSIGSFRSGTISTRFCCIKTLCTNSEVFLLLRVLSRWLKREKCDEHEHKWSE